MEPLKEMYKGPKDLLEKAKRENQALSNELARWDGQSTPDSLFNFSVTVYHVIDWIKAYESQFTNAAYTWLDAHEALGVFRDLSNASKHVILDVEGRAYKDHPPVLDKAELSATASSVEGGGPAFRLKIQSKNGTRRTVEEWANMAIKAWEEFFTCNGI